jgi:hypothetical protein
LKIKKQIGMCGIFAYLTNDDKRSNEIDKLFIEKQWNHGKSRGPESSEFITKEYSQTFLFMGFPCAHHVSIETHSGHSVDRTIFRICIDKEYS